MPYVLVLSGVHENEDPDRKIFTAGQDWCVLWPACRDIPKHCMFFVMGIGFVGPVLRVWYIALERIVGSTGGGAMVVKKVLLDQGVFTPVFIPSFLTTLGALQGRSWEGIKDMVRMDYLPILKANYMLWPAAQLINFRFVPLAYRVPFASCVALVWNTYLAWKANRTLRKT
ncbi:mitochondrial inner membrane protein Mpv17-like isoform X2 [Haemaphysalis longicornis]